ncbi:vacuolar protein sorting-associated protein 13a, partial [Plakobranchus ocellatus]
MCCKPDIFTTVTTQTYIRKDSHHSSVQGESDSEPDGFISSMTARLGNIFSSNSSSDADVSDTEDDDDDENDDGIDMSLDKPVFLTSRGPVHVSADEESEQIEPQTIVETSAEVTTATPQPENSPEDKKAEEHETEAGSGTGHDMVDGGRNGRVGAGTGLDEEGGGASNDKCLYVMIDAMDKLQLNVTPHAVAVLKDVVQALTDPTTSELHSIRSKPRFSVNNQLGLHVYITCHQKIKVRNGETTDATIYHAGQDENIYHPADYANDIESDSLKSSTAIIHSDYSISRMLAEAGHTLVSAGAFVFDDDDDYLSGDQIDQNRLRLQVEGFEQTKTYLHKRARRTLVPLTPIK